MFYFVVGESHDAQAVSTKVFFPCSIVGGLVFALVNAAIYFDHKLSFNAERIEDKWAERMLASELEAAKTTATQ